MYANIAFTLLLAAAVDARFGQEQGNGAIQAISALSDLGQPGQAATLGGESIQFLLAAANPCAKLKQADKIVSQLGTSDKAIAAARGLVAAEQNFNPFNVAIPSICSDPTLPTTPELRGVVPLIDPAVTGSDVENANSKKSVTSPFSADGLSVAQIMVANGFSNFTAVDAAGTKVAASQLGGAASSGSSSASSGSSSSNNSSSSASSGSSSSSNSNSNSNSNGCVVAAPTTLSTVVASATATAAASSSNSSGSSSSSSAATDGTGAVQDPKTGNFPGFVKSTIAGLDFGKCVPTMKFEAGLNGRKDTEFTFQAIDPLVNKGQQEALNPNIITNRIKDQLTNVCGANQAAKDAAVAAAAKIKALGTKDQSTADAWNTELGFAGTNTNPDNAPVAGLVGHT